MTWHCIGSNCGEGTMIRSNAPCSVRWDSDMEGAVSGSNCGEETMIRSIAPGPAQNLGTGEEGAGPRRQPLRVSAPHRGG